MARYIDMDKLLENLKKQYGEDLGWQCTVNMSDIGMMIEDAHTADVAEVRHGEWVSVTYTYFGLKRYECSECRDDEYWQKRYLEHKEKFCPNCGADMRGDKDDL